MTSKMMWFGTVERMGWVPVPLADAEYANVGWTASETLLNGGGWARNSWTSHKEFGLSWGMQLRETTQIIKDYADGLYGEGPFYFVDPMAGELNLLPAWWAAPMMGTLDAPVLVPGQMPVKVLTEPNANNYPVYSAKYDLGAALPNTDMGNAIVVPIPPDRSLNVGWHGQYSGSAVVAARGVRANLSLGPVVNLPHLTVQTSTRTNTMFAGSEFVAARIYLTRTGYTPGTLTLSGLIANLDQPGQVIEAVAPSPTPYFADDLILTDSAADGTDADLVVIDAPADPSDPDLLVYNVADGGPGSAGYINPVTVGKFIGGRGHSGVSFVGHPIESPVGGRPEMSTIAAKFTETGGW